MSKYIVYFIKPYLPVRPACIQDTTDVLFEIEQIKYRSKEAFLVTLAVEFLLTNIEQKEGLALCYTLSNRPPTEMLPSF